MMLARRLIPASKRASRSSQRLLFPQRHYATEAPAPKPLSGAGAIQHHMSNSAALALTATGRFFKWSIIAAVTLGVSVFGALEGAHQYVENWAMEPEKDEEVRKYEWDLAGDHWHGDIHAGGTDPGLGFYGRHAIRSAWQVRNWGLGASELYAPGVIEKSMRPTTDFVTLEAAQYMKIAIGIAQQRPNNLHPNTLAELFNRYASLCERLGGDYLALAYANYKKAWEAYSGQGPSAARVALRLGDVSRRLGQNNEAQNWWRTAIQCCQRHPDVGPLLQPTRLPASPWAQRILASTLVSISAYYAQTGQLREAEDFEKSALDYLRAVPTPSSLNAASPPQALHALFLLQRSSLISIHIAEVLHARKASSASSSSWFARPAVPAESLDSIQWLTAAAESSERVARALAGMPLQIESPTSNTGIPDQNAQIAPAYSSSRNMKDVASRLYTDAKRTSAEAWNLLGVLYEQREGSKSKMALQCYERAIQWSGQVVENEAAPQANESTKESDWKVFWSNFQRSKEETGSRK